MGEDQPRYRDEEEEHGEQQQAHPLLHETANGHANGTTETDPAKDPRWTDTEYKPTWLSSLRPSSPSFSGTVRAIFNYPEPGLELRGTAWLDGLRGLAAFEVFVFHYCDGWVNNRLSWGYEDNQYTDPSWWLLPGIRTLYASGDASVCLFFAISGYVLSHRMLKLIRQQRLEEFHGALSSAVFRRAIRLYMPVAIETFILMLLCRLLGLPKPVDYFPADTFILEIKGWWVSFVHLWIPLRWPALWYDILNRYDGHISWTIPLEFFGSLVTYLVLLAVSRIPTMTVRQGVIWTVIAHSFAKDDWISAVFLLGMVFADWQLRNEEKEKVRQQQQIPPSRAWESFRKVFFPCLFLFGFYLSGMPPGNFRHDYENDPNIFSRPFYDWISQPLVYFGIYADRQADRYILCVAGISSVIGVGETPFLKRIAMSRPVQYLGKISFGLYLCHVFMRAWLRPMNQFYVSIVGLKMEDLEQQNRKASLQLVIAYCCHMLPAIPLNLIMGGLFERFLDRPSVNFAKTLEKWCLIPEKKAVLPASDPRPRPPQQPSLSTQETGIAMVRMDKEHRAVDPAASRPAVPHRASLPPPADFEEDEGTAVSEGKEKNKAVDDGTLI